MSRIRARLWWFAFLALPAEPAPVAAQVSATAMADATIVGPIGILDAAPGSSAALPANPATGMARLSGGGFAIRGPANEVVSVSVRLPANVQRVGGGPALPVTPARANVSRILTASGGAVFDVAGAAPMQGAAAGVYAGVAQVLVNLN